VVLVNNLVLKIIIFVVLIVFNFVQKVKNIIVVKDVMLFIPILQIGELKMMIGVLFHILAKSKK
jgi:hypothetical protein